MPAEVRRQSPEAAERRAKRLEAKRETVLRAALDLISEGERNPTMPKIVERSGTPERSIFRYFTDIGDLTQQVVALAVREYGDLEHIDDPGVGPLDDRIDVFVTMRLGVLERIHGLGQVARLRALLSPSIEEALKLSMVRTRRQTEAQFAPELDALSADERTFVLDSVALTVGFENFDVRRRRFDQSFDEIAAGWRDTIRRLLP